VRVYLNTFSKNLISCVGRSLEAHSEVPDRPVVDNGIERERDELELIVMRGAIALRMKTSRRVVLGLVVGGHGSKSGHGTDFDIVGHGAMLVTVLRSEFY
jgi:hypothetical protein